MYFISRVGMVKSVIKYVCEVNIFGSLSRIEMDKFDV